MTPASKATKKWRQAFKERDPEGYKQFRFEEAQRYNANPRVKEASKNNSWKNTLKHAYKMTPEEWLKIFESQNKVCALCGLPPIDGERLAVDHNHNTNKIRALVHRIPCNIIIGYIEKYGYLCDDAIAYLKKYQ